MQDNIFLLDVPNFYPTYENDKVYSYEGKGKENLKQVLIDSSNGYCMYCYTKILVDRKNFGHLEHSIEKVNCDNLTNCLANISITCSKCNLSFKKKGDNLRRLSPNELNDFENIIECLKNCSEGCRQYKKLREFYINKPGGEIILQPFGIMNRVTGNVYLLQYDILNQKFIPSQFNNYNNYEKKFIEKHINRFNLNDVKYRTKEFIKFIEDVIEFNSIPKKNRYCNLIVDLFIDKLKVFPIEKSIKICKVIYTQLLLKSKS